MINLSYLKRVKKRLHDTTMYFQLKGEKDMDDGKPITDERRIFYFNAARCAALNRTDLRIATMIVMNIFFQVL